MARQRRFNHKDLETLRRRQAAAKKQASPPPATPNVGTTEDPDHPAYYPDPAYDKYQKGDTSAWAEDVHPPPYPDSPPPATPNVGTTEDPDHPAYVPPKATTPATGPLTAQEATARMPKAASDKEMFMSLMGRSDLCVKVASALHPQASDNEIIEKAASLLEEDWGSVTTMARHLGIKTAAEEEEEDEDEDKKAMRAMNSRMARMEKHLARLASSSVDREIEALLEDHDLIAEDLDGDGIDQNDPFYGYVDRHAMDEFMSYDDFEDMDYTDDFDDLDDDYDDYDMMEVDDYDMDDGDMDYVDDYDVIMAMDDDDDDDDDDDEHEAFFKELLAMEEEDEEDEKEALLRELLAMEDEEDEKEAFDLFAEDEDEEDEGKTAFYELLAMEDEEDEEDGKEALFMELLAMEDDDDEDDKEASEDDEDEDEKEALLRTLLAMDEEEEGEDESDSEERSKEAYQDTDVVDPRYTGPGVQSGAGGNSVLEPAPKTPQVTGPMTGENVKNAADAFQAYGLTGHMDPMGLSGEGVVHTAADFGMNVDPLMSLFQESQFAKQAGEEEDEEVEVEVEESDDEEKEGGNKKKKKASAKLRPQIQHQGKVASVNIPNMGSPHQNFGDDLSKIWDAPPDIKLLLG